MNQREISFRHVWKKLLGAFAIFLAVTVLFLMAYLFYDYKGDQKSFKQRQHLEIQTLLKKESFLFKGLTALQDLTAQRLLAAGREDLKIQRLLNSLHSLTFSLEIPPLQTVSYIKLTAPLKIFTRFGSIPLQKPETSLEQGNIVFFKDGILTLQKVILNTHQTLEGLLKIEVSEESFKKSLGTYQTIDLSDVSLIRKKGSFLRFVKKPFPSFQDFCFTRWKTYQIFFAYLWVCSFLMTGFCFHGWRFFRKKYQSYTLSMEENLTEKKKQIATLSCDLTQLQQQSIVHKNMSQAQNSFLKEVVRNELCKSSYLYRSLNFVSQALAEEKVYQTQYEVLNACLPLAAYPLIEPSPQLEKETLFIRDILESVQDIFADKIDQNHLRLQIYNPENSQIRAHSFSIKLIFMNILGKCLYRIPRGGYLSITVHSFQNNLEIIVKDNGFDLSPKQEELIERKHLFFMNQEALETLLRHNKVQHVKEEELQKIILITSCQKGLNEAGSNVVSLFQ